MTTATLLLVFGSAFAHAVWNLLLKGSQHKTVFLWSFTAVAFAAFLVPSSIFAYVGGVSLEGALYGGGSALLHGCYGLSLARGYHLGDLSAVYPISRGVGIAVIPAVAVLFLGERVSAPASVGIALVVLGIYTIQVEALSPQDLLRPVRALARPANRTALLTGSFIASYSLWDKVALGHLSPVVLNQFNLVGYLLMLAPTALGEGGGLLRSEWRSRAPSIVAAGVLAPLAYVLVLTALTTSRISYVGPAREVGIVLGALFGVTLLGEAYGAARVLGAVFILSGILTLGLAP